MRIAPKTFHLFLMISWVSAGVFAFLLDALGPRFREPGSGTALVVMLLFGGVLFIIGLTGFFCKKVSVWFISCIGIGVLVATLWQRAEPLSPNTAYYDFRDVTLGVPFSHGSTVPGFPYIQHLHVKYFVLDAFVGALAGAVVAGFAFCLCHGFFKRKKYPSPDPTWFPNI